jgi:1-acyl-sn-glycerol-3-phosphate acyltransferase
VSETSDRPDEVPEAPTAESLAPMVKVLGPVRQLIKPKFYGIEKVPPAGALMVGNHTLYGVLDVALLYAELFDRGIVPRGLIDHAHFRVPGIRNLLSSSGGVAGTRPNTRELMRRGELIVVFPGGGREVTKRKGEQYQLIWKNRLGFAKMAIETGYPIIPFACVGTEHGLDVVMDADSPLMAPARMLFKKLLGTSDTPPIVRGIGLSPIPRPERLYYWFGDPISTEQYDGVADETNAREARLRTANAIEAGIKFLLDERESDPGRSLISRLRGKGGDTGVVDGPTTDKTE